MGAKDESGFSLLEMVVAMAILGLALAGLVGGLALVIRVSETVEKQAVTETAATQYVEEHLNGSCPPKKPLMGVYEIEGHTNTEEEKYIVSVSSEGGEPFTLSTSAAGDCPENEDE